MEIEQLPLHYNPYSTFSFSLTLSKTVTMICFLYLFLFSVWLFTTAFAFDFSLLNATDAQFVSYYELANSVGASLEEVQHVQLLMTSFRSFVTSPSSQFIDCLGRRLSRQARIYHQHRNAILPPEGASTSWATHSEALLAHEMSDVDSELFYAYYDWSWDPQLFHWSDMGAHIVRQYIPILGAAEHFRALWLPALRSGNAYGHVLPRYITMNMGVFQPGRVVEVSIRTERVQHVYQYFVLQKATGALPKDFAQVVEFGGGTGDNAALLRELRCGGVHFIIDLPETLLFQQYFLSLAHWPVFSYLERDLFRLDALANHNQTDPISGTDIEFNPTESFSDMDIPTNSQSTLLVHDLDLFRSKYQLSLSDHTLFCATFSLSESPLSVRSQILDNYFNYGTIFITMQNSFDGYENIDWMRKFAADRQDSYHFCLWKDLPRSDEFMQVNVFLARRKHMGRIICDHNAGCNPRTVLFCNDYLSK